MREVWDSCDKHGRVRMADLGGPGGGYVCSQCVANAPTVSPKDLRDMIQQPGPPYVTGEGEE